MKSRIRKIQNKLSRVVPPDRELLTNEIIQGYLNPGWGLGTRPRDSGGIERVEESGIHKRKMKHSRTKKVSETHPKNG